MKNRAHCNARTHTRSVLLRRLYLGGALAVFGTVLAPISMHGIDTANKLGAARAADAPAPAEAPKDTVKPELIKILQPVQDLVKTQNYKDALTKLAETDAIANKTPFEIYVIESLRAVAAEGVGDTDGTAAAFEKVFTTGRMAPDRQQQVMLALAGKYYEKKEQPKAIAWGKRYIEAGGKDPAAHQILFRAYYFGDDIANAGTELEWLVQEDEKAGRVPAQENLNNLAAIYQEQKNDAGYATMIEKLASHYPKKEYWANMLNIAVKKPTFPNYLDLDTYRLLLETDNVARATQYREMAKIALQESRAIEAQKVLEKGYSAGLLGTGADAAADKTLRDTINKRAAVDQKSLPEDEKQVAKNKDGTGSVNVGLSYLAAGQPDKAVELIEQGIAKGGLKHPDAAKLQLGYAYMMAGKKDKAIEAFKSIQSNEGAYDIAHIWIVRAGQPS